MEQGRSQEPMTDVELDSAGEYLDQLVQSGDHRAELSSRAGYPVPTATGPAGDLNADTARE